jgi:hypothetical protein
MRYARAWGTPGGSSGLELEAWAIDTFLRREMDLLDAKTSRHTGECEFASETDAAVLRVILKVKDGAGGGYWWVECGSCDAGWQVTHYAESVG